MKKLFLTIIALTSLALSSTSYSASLPSDEMKPITVDTYQDFKNKSAYTVLGLPLSANDTEIKARFRDLSKQLHPDKNKGNEAAAKEAFQLLRAAYTKIEKQGFARENEKKIFNRDARRAEPRKTASNRGQGRSIQDLIDQDMIPAIGLWGYLDLSNQGITDLTGLENLPLSDPELNTIYLADNLIKIDALKESDIDDILNSARPNRVRVVLDRNPISVEEFNDWYFNDRVGSEFDRPDVKMM